MSDRDRNNRNGYQRGGRGGTGSRHGRGRGGFHQNRNSFQKKEKTKRREKRIETSYRFSSKDVIGKTEFKTGLRSGGIEIVQVPSYGGNDRDKS